MPRLYAETNSGGTYSAGNPDFSETAMRTSDEDNGLHENPEGVSSNEQTTETTLTDTYLSEIAESNQALVSVNLVLVVAVFLCFGALCVRTLIKSFEV